MPTAAPTRFTLNDLRQARAQGRKVPMLTCYDYSTARLMSEAGVPTILVGDSAANVILGHDSTVKGNLAFQIQITAAVRRGAPNALLVGVKPLTHLIQRPAADLAPKLCRFSSTLLYRTSRA